MRWLVLVLTCAVSVAAQTQPEIPPLSRLFTRPYIWGTSPSSPAWAKKGPVLCFLWNAEGRRFLDLYCYNAESKKLARLTSLEAEKDDLNVSEDEKDERLKRYQVPNPGLASFELAEDGRQAAFTYKGDIWLAGTDGAKPPFRLTRTKAAESFPRFSPDGKRLASLRGGQLIIQNLSNGQLWQVTDIEQGNLSNYQWSPDGKNFVIRVSKGTPRAIPLPNYSGRYPTARTIPRQTAGDESVDATLSLIGAEGGKPRPIDRGGDKWSSIDAEWSPDGKRLFIAQLSPDWKKRRIYTVDATTLKATQVFEETDPRWVDYGFANWSEDGNEVLFTSEKDGFAHLYRVKATGGDAVQITKGNFEIRKEPFTADPRWDAGWIWFSSTEGDTAQRQFYRIRPDGTGKEKLSTGEGLHIGMVSDGAKHRSIMRATEREPFDLWVDGTRVTTSPKREFASVPWPAVRYVQFPSKGDGKSVAAKVLLPKGYNPDDKSGKQWPAVVYVHGAGIATSVLRQWGSYNEYRYVFNAYLTSLGYVVIDLDYRGSTGYGRDWRSDAYLHMGGNDLNDVLGAVDYLKGLGNIDTAKLGTWGVSYGGFMTATSLFQAPGVFRAGAAWAGVYDWENYNAGYTAQRLNTPALNPEAYRRSSPIWFSNNLRDHLLIVHGMVDNNVLFQDAVQLTEKLIQEGKQFDHIYYPEESHGFVRDETWIDAFGRTAAWFERWLK
ncbi:MAG: S9 family peptidase [Bryobacteraceae bacterium]|nr:S9 family peptidase [Bryobacteraceae bacterium]